MEWTCENFENLFNYLRVNYGVTKIFRLDIESDLIGFWYDGSKARVAFISSIYKEMLDKQKEV